LCAQSANASITSAPAETACRHNPRIFHALVIDWQ
jgi:hypothetical protein